jgi:hypothetical protein
VVGGGHLAFGLVGPLAIDLGFDVVAALTDEKLMAGATQVVAFSRWSLDLSLALVYRR